MPEKKKKKLTVPKARAKAKKDLAISRKEMDDVSAMIVSFNTIRLNTLPMLLWAAIIVALTVAGFVTWFIGLVVVLPVIGHGTWHAYRDCVE